MTQDAPAYGPIVDRNNFCIVEGHPWRFDSSFSVTGWEDSLEVQMTCQQCGAKLSGTVTAKELVEALGDNFYRIER